MTQRIYWRKYWVTAQSLGREASQYKRFNGAVVYAPRDLPKEPGAVVQVILEMPGEYATTVDTPTRLLAAWHQHVPEHEHCYCKREHNRRVEHRSEV
jgi:hypothetical protein